MSEEWKTIPSAPLYQASDLGRIRRSAPGKWAKVGRVLKPQKGYKGCMNIRLCVNGGKKTFKIHQLVLETFVGQRPSPNHVSTHFPDRNKSNNSLSNLRWGTAIENEQDKYAHGTRGTAMQINTAWLIRYLAAYGYRCCEICSCLNLARTTVNHVIAGRTWACDSPFD